MLRSLAALALCFLFMANALPNRLTPLLAGASVAKDLEFPAKPSRFIVLQHP